MRFKIHLFLVLCFSLLLSVNVVNRVEAATVTGFLDEKSNRTIVPIRFISEKFGAAVNWHEASQTVTISKENNQIQLQIGKAIAFINGNQTKLDTPAVVHNGSTLVPLRFIGDTFGAKTDWEAKTSTVKIQLNNQVINLPIISKSATATSNSTSSKAISSFSKTFKVGGATIKANIITVDLNKGNFKFQIGLANNEIGAVENLDSIAKRYNAKIAINASFFNAYTDDVYKQPYGTVFIDGKELHSGSGDKRALFAIDEENNISIQKGEDFRSIMYEKNYKGAIQAGPTLVKNGQVSLDPVAEGHRDPKILTNGGARSALGITSNNKLILLTTNGATIPQLAEVMKQAGAYDAMNLDGGASSCLYYNGKYITPPGRKISNAIIITE